MMVLDNEGRVWTVVYLGGADEGIKVLGELDGKPWTGWVTYDDKRLFDAGESPCVSVLWAQEV